MRISAAAIVSDRAGGRASSAALLAIGLLAVLALVLPGSAGAAYSHLPSEKTFPVEGCSEIADIAVDESEGYVYVICDKPYPEPVVIKRYHLDGSEADFGGSAPYISGNELIGDPGSAEGTFGREYTKLIAVDNSSSPNNGKLFVTNSPNVDVFRPDGTFAGAVVQPVESSIPNRLTGLDVGPDGSIYIASLSPGDRVSKYEPSFREVKRLYGSIGGFGSSAFGDPERVQVDSTGAIWEAHGGFSVHQLTKYEADQFTEELGIPAFNPPAEQVEPWIADPSPFVADPLLAGGFNQFDVDVTTNDLYVDRENRIETYSQGTPEETAYPDAPTFGGGELHESNAIAVTRSHRVYASTNAGARGELKQKIVIYPAGDILPDVHTYPSDIEEVGHTSATLHGMVEPAGGDPVDECFVEYSPSASYSSEVGTAPCTPDASSSNYSSNTEISAELSGLTEGQLYHYRLVAGNGHGTNTGIDRTVRPAFVLQAKTLPAEEIDASGATLKASFDPDEIETHYHFEYGITTGYGEETPSELGGSGKGVIVVGQPIGGLPSGRVFHFRLVAENENGTTYGPDLTFRTGSVPDIGGVRTSDIGPSSAVLHARINPVGYDTEYTFEYGTTPNYGQSVPLPMGHLDPETEPIDLEEVIEGLEYGVTYHFRVVAKNTWGTATSDDTTFDYAPPLCPNDHVRQQTGSSYLPDCRAYELVSPGSAGAVVFFPSHAAFEKEQSYFAFNRETSYPVNRGFASAPSRFAFFGGTGVVSGLNAPNSFNDMYMGTRTNTGWVTTVPGLTGSEAFETGQKECSESMDLCIDRREPAGEEFGFPYEFAPYLFTAAGEKLGQLPTNLSVIPGGREFEGQERMSGDFSHFVFGSAEAELPGPCCEKHYGPAVAFAPGGVTTGMGSLYDNDIAAKTVSLISKLPGGGPLPEVVPTAQGIQIGGVSPDGSHVLMQTPAAGGRSYLYMRVGGGLGVTYEVSEGKPATPIGMTRNGSKVFFTTPEKLSSQDTDSSDDLYMWSEATGQLTLLSQGDGNGNADTCSASWASGCSVEPLTPEYAHPNGNRAVSAPNSMDDLMAEVSGDVYFYSPETLDGSRPGIRNQRNLYVYRDGGVHLVATLDPGTEVNRMQISSNGLHAAMLTASQLTSYDNRGFREMYTFNPETDRINCASCNPGGTPPTGDVAASQGGRFMAEDGRVFFTSRDSLVPRDRDGKILDVYEYVSGRPQLITSGLGSRDYTGGSEILNLLTKPQHTGLEAVSRDGTDVFFSTFETLVSQDNNGEFVKFYDARTGGGFPNDPQPAPCAAADECHGEGSAPPAPPITATGVNLGGGGNVVSQPKTHRKKHRGHRRRGRRHHGKNHRGKNHRGKRHQRKQTHRHQGSRRHG
jgi:hypothetical protein